MTYTVILYIFFTYTFLIILIGVFNYKKIQKKSIKRKRKKKKISKNKKDKLYFFIIIPCYNEEKVIRRTLYRLFKNTFNGEVVVVDDDSSDKTTQIVEKMNNDRIKLIKRKLPNAQKGKGDSLNLALKYVRAKSSKMDYDKRNIIVGVLDADGALCKQAFRKLKVAFSKPHIKVVQLRVKMYNSFKNMLQVSQDVEFFTINNLAQITRRYSRTIALSGNGQFFRLGTILTTLGKKPWGTALLDDYEMTLKLMMAGVEITYMPEAYVYQESLSSVKKFIKQRSRWVQGNLDCLKYFRVVMKSKRIDVVQKTGVIYFLLQPWINFISDMITIILFFSLWYIIIFKVKFSISIATSLLGLFMISLIWGGYFTCLYLKNLKDFGEKRPRLKLLVELPFIISYVYVFLFFSIIIAFYRKAFNKNSWFKTERDSEH